MALYVWQRTITDGEGNVVPGAEITVQDQSSAELVQLYSDVDGNEGIGNPFTADDDGFAIFYADVGRYKITASSGGNERIWNNVLLGTRSEDIRYPTTQEEIAASVSPNDFNYPPGDPRRINSVTTTVVTINVPSDVATLQDAINLYPVKLPGDIRTEINIESGFSPAAGIAVANGDWGHVRIVSEDATVTVDSGFSGIFLSVSRAIGPQLSCLIDMDDKGTAGVFATEGSSVVVRPNAGTINSGGRGLWVRRASNACAFNTVWDGAATDGITANEASTIDCRGSTADGCGERGIWANNSFIAARETSAQNCGLRGVQCDPGSVIVAGTNVSGSLSIGLRCQGGFLSCSSAVANNCAGDALSVIEGGTVRAHGFTGQNAGANGCEARNGSSVMLRDADLSGATQNGIYALGATNVDARGADCSGAGTFGINVEGGGIVAFEGGTGTLSQEPNLLTADGIIFVSTGFRDRKTSLSNQFTGAQIADAGHSVNTNFKVLGKIIIDTTNDRLMYALGPGATDGWRVVDGSATVTPS